MEPNSLDTTIAQGRTKFPVKICKIGVKCEYVSFGNHFRFDGRCFRLLTINNYMKGKFYPNSRNDSLLYLNNGNLVQFNVDINKVPEFRCRTYHELNENNERETTLWVVLVSNLTSSSPFRNFGAAKRLIDAFFVFPKRNLFDDNVDSNDIGDFNQPRESERNRNRSFESTVENLYKNLQEAHAADDCRINADANDHIQHEYLTVQLKPYQLKTVKWMLDRERFVKHQNSGFVEVVPRAGSNDQSIKFYYNSSTVILTTDCNVMKSFTLPTGGILAEQMGMGKTIEILDLMLLNPRPLEVNRSLGPRKNDNTAPKVLKSDVKCLCAQASTNKTVQCTKCLKHQHRKCVGQQDLKIAPDSSYICPACWQSEELLPAKTTLVVSPRSIKAQWKTEIDKRIQRGKMSILVYLGCASATSKWLNPMLLASYDIVLTDYETLRSEFVFSGRNVSSRVLRNTSCSMKPRSPLLDLNFWRVCLDESQMVIDMSTRYSQVISDLSAVHRWAVTGTPIEKKLDDLFGLISFINYEPYNQRDRFDQHVNALNASSHFEQLVSILQPIMRRTGKSNSILNEMGVPEQIQKVHYVELNCLNRFQYNQEREKCRNDFNRLIRTFSLGTPLTSLSPYALERLMDPVRTLRRNCSILHVSDQDGQTIVMRPQQMLQYLFSTNESEASSELKSIGMKLKSFLQLSLGDHQRRAQISVKALSIFENVLDWAKKYDDEPTMVDSLLQMQTIQNMLFLNKNQRKYNSELGNLESHFYNTQLDAVVNFKAERNNEIASFANFELSFERDCFRWARAALEYENSAEQLFNNIKTRTSASFENVGSIIGSIPNIVEVLTYWSTNLLKKRKEMKQSFDELNTLAIEVELKYAKEKRSAEFFAKLLKEATDCHVIESGGDDSMNDSSDDYDGPTPAKKRKKQCILCTINEQLGAYGVFVTDTAHKMTKKTGRGSDVTNPSFQEFVLKVILQSNEYSGIIDTKVGIDLLTGLENFRDEFQKYKNLLNGITKKISFFSNVQKRKSPKPTITYCAKTIQEWYMAVETSKAVYERKVRVNRYLNCLKENGEDKECSICMSEMEQYIVFECGHQCCSTCFQQLLTHYNQFECPFCRQIQSRSTVHHFTMDKSEKFTDSSKKIELIVRQVYELKKSDPKVKILIFSQWIDILNALKLELLANEIPSRSVFNTSKSFEKIVAEFKDPQSNVMCLLMPYKYGSKGLNLIEATNVFLVEPIINRGEELQTLGRVHRIGQTRQTCVHRFITKNTIEETIFKVMSTDAAGLLSSEQCTIKTLVDLFADTESHSGTMDA